MLMLVNQTETPLYIKVNEKDNAAIIANAGGLPKGTVFPCGLNLQERIPQGHKVALTNITQGGPVIRYGEVIGYAVKPIEKGGWISESHIMLPEAPPLDELSIANKVPKPAPPLEGYTFEGYRNEDGSVGTRNVLGIMTSVQCVAGVLDYAVKRIKEELLPKYPNVDGVAALNHQYGCGVAINAPEAKIPIRTIQNIARHPNFGGEAMVIGLGCEKLLPMRIEPEGDAENILSLQERKGFQQMIQSIMEMAEERLKRLNARKRTTCPASDLVIGLQCGGSDAFSGVTANPAAGYAADLLVRAGATVLFSEVTEVRDAVHLLTPRAVNEEVGRALIREMAWYDRYLERGESDRSANPSPGNKKGGLANVVEKSLGSIAKSGSSPINAVLAPGERAVQKGLTFAATPASDFVCGTLQLASGMHLQVFTTGRGTPYGLEMAPVLKVATRQSLSEDWRDLIDVNAGRIATGEASIEEVGWEIFKTILAVASGRKTWAEHWGLSNDLCLFNPAPVT
ncbi:galactarate dehydratase [Bacillus paralicheniformis]|uniref:galactarate dehydratase n=2 Tax=Bacillaceae TaxID=186817 RepID=UPI001151D8D4|nr:galactarate dehydratase [Bacillus paralicheniformis]MSO00157.1 galactarate dehydratase [Bacillus paralicheniformis]MSO04164.1 galactarate dehydratase [Bacillus paralicheniformis]MSO08157.1 galactarate dehydratase [Bacillus paralicheniformis]MSO12151.1 galactarate dehydratase [Bacillus paralicheniformis]NJE38408.1 galactarate dehydratase [Bacillus paralicheniformis]